MQTRYFIYFVISFINFPTSKASKGPIPCALKCPDQTPNCRKSSCVCPNGYSKHSVLPRLCNPVCSRDCVAGSCVRPEICACNNGYQLDRFDKYLCVPKCLNGCKNGFCSSPNKCSCNEGYILDDTQTNNCVCKDGYVLHKEKGVELCVNSLKFQSNDIENLKTTINEEIDDESDNSKTDVTENTILTSITETIENWSLIQKNLATENTLLANEISDTSDTKLVTQNEHFRDTENLTSETIDATENILLYREVNVEDDIGIVNKSLIIENESWRRDEKTLETSLITPSLENNLETVVTTENIILTSTTERTENWSLIQRNLEITSATENSLLANEITDKSDTKIVTQNENFRGTENMTSEAVNAAQNTLITSEVNIKDDIEIVNKPLITENESWRRDENTLETSFATPSLENNLETVDITETTFLTMELNEKIHEISKEQSITVNKPLIIENESWRHDEKTLETSFKTPSLENNLETVDTTETTFLTTELNEKIHEKIEISKEQSITDIIDIPLDFHEEPKCTKECVNSRCIAEDKCFCDNGYVLDVQNPFLCVEIGKSNLCTNCVNGNCINPGICQCFDGFELNSKTALCELKEVKKKSFFKSNSQILIGKLYLIWIDLGFVWMMSVKLH